MHFLAAVNFILAVRTVQATERFDAQSKGCVSVHVSCMSLVGLSVSNCKMKTNGFTFVCFCLVQWALRPTNTV